MARAKAVEAKGEATTKIRKQKKVKDENAPKKNLTPYFIWLSENRARIASDGTAAKDVLKKAGQEWRNVADKTEWEKKAAADKKRYEKELSEYNASK